MHTGRFLASPAGAPISSDHLQSPPSRRDWLRSLAVGGLGLVAGAYVPRLWFGGASAPAAANGEHTDAPAETPAPAPANSDLGWALDMVRRPDAELLHAAGELEMIAARHRHASGLVAVFDRMLDLALFDLGDPPQLDIAGACALRSLQRLGASSLAVGRADEVRALAERPLTHAALELVERRHQREAQRAKSRGLGR